MREPHQKPAGVYVERTFDVPQIYISVTRSATCGRSDHLANSGGLNDEDNEAEVTAIETWGLIAAVLGNMRNRAAFQQKFWWDEEYGFRVYLTRDQGSCHGPGDRTADP